MTCIEIYNEIVGSEKKLKEWDTVSVATLLTEYNKQLPALISKNQKDDRKISESQRKNYLANAKKNVLKENDMRFCKLNEYLNFLKQKLDIFNLKRMPPNPCAEELENFKKENSASYKELKKKFEQIHSAIKQSDV